MPRIDLDKGFFGYMKGFFFGFSTVAVLAGAFILVRQITGNQQRQPAAINRGEIFDLSGLDGSALKAASARQLLHKAEIQVAEGEVLVSLGHFLSRNSFGEKLPLCTIFDQVTLRFEAEGIAVNGERPSLEVLAPCSAADSANITRPIAVPFGEIILQKPSDGEMTFGSHSDHSYQAKNVSGSWPKTWVLTEVRVFKKDNPGEAFHLDRRDVYNFSLKPIMMNW